MFGITSVVYSDTKELPEGTKLYCKEVNFIEKINRLTNNLDFELFNYPGSVIKRERTNSNIRVLFILSDEIIYKIGPYDNWEYLIDKEFDYKITGKIREYTQISDNHNIIYLKETRSIRENEIYDFYSHHYDYNCSTNKNSIY